MNTEFCKEPISNVEWVDVRNLKANDYNPNVVLNQELNLLEFSLLKQGWIQPILVSNDNIIIDGFHRYWLSSNSKKVVERYNYMAPIVRLELSEAERMLLTIRINRAKGNHIAFKMHEIISTLITKHKLPFETIMKEIGASKQEVELLSKDGVFEILDIENYQYSEAWKPLRRIDK